MSHWLVSVGVLNHGAAFNLGSAKVCSPTIFERYFSYDRYIWIAVTYYVHPTGGGHIIFAFSAVRRPDAWFPLI